MTPDEGQTRMRIHRGPARVNILGVEISAVSLERAVTELARWITDRERHYVHLCTVHTIMECRRSKRLRAMVNGAGMATPDGMPLVWRKDLFAEEGLTAEAAEWPEY